MRRRVTVVIVFLFMAFASAAAAQTGWAPADRLPAEAPRTTRPALAAVRAERQPVIDGRLDDTVWQRAAAATSFVQRNPRPGEHATQRTEARVAYDESAIYVAIRAYDTAPDSIASQLARRDATGIFSDWVDVIIDSFHDRRSGYRFSVNPHGVKKDVFHFDDGDEDLSWDAVWDVATSIDEHGWTAEYRIPLSQIRFASNAGEQTWGLQFGRTIARYEETSFWSPILPNAGGFMSLAGELRNVTGLGSPRRLEVLPYVVSRVSRTPEPAGPVPSPFWRRTDPGGSAGADLKYGLTSNLTLTATVNPDFGQVEADPSVVNLSAFETFFPERRPFFLEGADLFSLNIGDDGAGENLFYSRRIGRAPQRSFDDADHVNTPDAARILGAGKLTGRVGDWSVGFFNATTQAVNAEVLRNGAVEELPAEPMTNFAVGRLTRAFRNGASSLGGMFTTVHRDIDDPAFHGLRSSAYAAGIAGHHRFGPDNRFQVTGHIAASSIFGDTLALQLAQRAPQRYYQRPDADHVEYDPGRTSLHGLAGTIYVSKRTGGRWNATTGGSFRTPGFEVNDAGFQMNGDQRFVFFSFNYHHADPGRILRSWNVGFNPNAGWDFGGTRLWTQFNTWGGATFNNFWNVNFFANNRWSATSTAALRGGPAIHSPGGNNYNVNVTSDRRRAVWYSLNTNGYIERGTSTQRTNTSATLAWRPSARLDLALQPAFNRNHAAWQYVGSPARVEAGTREYIFGELDQTTVSLTTRLGWTFTRDLSFQFYAQPFISAGEYARFLRVVEPTAASFDRRFRAFTDAELALDGTTYTAQVDNDEVRFRNPDFNIRQFRSNAVLRWEYRPGSTLFVVWSQGRGDGRTDGSFDFRRDVEDLFGLASSNVLMVKLNYWLNL